jgi:hypothetical protein
MFKTASEIRRPRLFESESPPTAWVFYYLETNLFSVIQNLHG